MPPKKWMIIAPGLMAWPCPCRRPQNDSEQAQAGARVGLEQELDRLAVLSDIGHAERCQDAVVDRVVEEQHLGRLDRDVGQRQQPRPRSGRRRRRPTRSTKESTQRADRDTRRRCARIDAEEAGREVVRSASRSRLGIRSAEASSNFLMRNPPSGPTIIPPRNIGTPAPTIMPGRRHGADDAAAVS